MVFTCLHYSGIRCLICRAFRKRFCRLIYNFSMPGSRVSRERRSKRIANRTRTSNSNVGATVPNHQQHAVPLMTSVMQDEQTVVLNNNVASALGELTKALLVFRKPCLNICKQAKYPFCQCLLTINKQYQFTQWPGDQPINL